MANIVVDVVTKGPSKTASAAQKKNALSVAKNGVTQTVVNKAAELGVKKRPPAYADASYWDELNALMKNADNYKANMALQKSRVNEDYQTQFADMQTQRGRDLPAIEDDFAARGIVKSGLYGKRVGEYEQDYQNALSKLQQAQQRQLQDISMGYQNYLDQWRMQKQAAQKAAIQRKLAKQKK